MNFICVADTTPFTFQFNFLSEVVRCGISQKKPLRDSTRSTALSGLNFWDVPQIAASHKKFTRLQ